MDHYTHPPCLPLLLVFAWKSFCLPSTLPSRYTQPQTKMPDPHHTGVGGWGGAGVALRGRLSPPVPCAALVSALALNSPEHRTQYLTGFSKNHMEAAAVAK